MPRHDGRVIWLTYKPEGNVKKTVYMVRRHLKSLKFQNPTKRQESMSSYEWFFQVGKGITYDTGGADIKAGGIMAGKVVK